MDVKEIIATAAHLGVGLDEPTPDDIPSYLRFLNLAHFELYSLIASSNLPAFLKDTLIDNGDLIENVLFVHSACMVGERNPLLPILYHDLIARDPFLEDRGQPTYWYSREVVNDWTINVYPSDENLPQLKVFYVNQPTPLKYEDNEDVIPYPKIWHPTLLDGTVYYMVQGEEGFNSSVDLSVYVKRWESTKSKFVANRQSNKMKRMSTFSNV